MDVATCEFPSASSSGSSTDGGHASLDYGQFMAFLEREDGQITCLHQGRERCVVYDSPCLPLIPPSVRTPYDHLQHKQHHGPPAPGAKFKTFKEVCYLYTNYPGERVPLPLACDLINESDAAEPLRGSAMTFVLSIESSTAYIGYLMSASGPDLCTLTVGGIRAKHGDSSSSDQSTFREWSYDCAPLSLAFIEAYDLPSKIRQMNTEKVQEKVILCCRSDYHVTLFEVGSSGHTLLHCIAVCAADGPVCYAQLSPYIAGEVAILTERGSVFLRRKSGELLSLPPCPLQGQRFTLCCFGGQPRSLMLATNSKLYCLDIRDGVDHGELTAIFEAPLITCLSRDVSHPFRVLVATDHTLFLLDVRQPDHALLAIQHQLNSLPFALSAIQTKHETTMVLLTSAVDCESVVVCYNGRDSPPYFALSPHSVLTPSEQLRWLRGLPISSSLPLVGLRFVQPAIGAALMPLDKDNFAAVMLTSLGDSFYQCWHYAEFSPSLSPSPSLSLSPSLSPSPSLSLSPSLSVGYRLWLSEASSQEQELTRYRDLPAMGTVDMNAIAQYLVSSSEDGLCLRCHHMHSQHFPNLKIADYMTSTSSSASRPPPPPPPPPPPSFQRCSFCSEPFGSLVVSSSPLTSDLVSLREVCAIREPQTELECSLTSKWITSGSEIQRDLLEISTTDTPTLKLEQGDDPGDGVLGLSPTAKTTPTKSHAPTTSKTRRIGF